MEFFNSFASVCAQRSFSENVGDFYFFCRNPTKSNNFVSGEIKVMLF